MLQDRYETDKIFEDILKLTNEMDPILAEIDQLLDDEELYQLIRSDLARRFPQTEVTGRNSTPVEVILRMLAIKRLYALSYEQTEYQVRDSLVMRQFCRVYLQDVPDDTTLIRWANLIQPETLEQFNNRLTELACQLKVTRGRKMRTDGTVVETNIHPPSDSSLLADSVRVLGRTLSRARQVLGEQTELGKTVFRNRIRSVRRLARQVGEAMRRGGEQAKTEGKRAYRKLIQATEATIKQAQQVLLLVQKQAAHPAKKLAQILETFIPRAQQVVTQTVQRVLRQEKVPASEKIVSIFEPHTDIIRRNKAYKPTESSRKLYKHLLAVVQSLLQQVAEIQPRLRKLQDPSADGLQEELDHYLPLVKQVIQQTQQRVLHGVPATAADKVLSLFEPHTALICRGKAKPKETEFGRKIWYAEVDGGLISEYRLLKGNPDEAQFLIPSVQHHCQRFGQPPQEVCGDRGIYSPENEQQALALGVCRVSLPQPGYKTDRRRQHEKQPWFRAAQRFRNGIESRISQLRRARHLDRCLAHGELGMERWIGWGIIANNLATIAQFLIKHHRFVPLTAS